MENLHLLCSSILIIIIILLFHHLRRLTCKCDTCRCFVSRGWASSFPSLPDWYTHLLHRSPTSTIQIHVLRNTVTANPANIEYMLKTNFKNYPKGKPHSVLLGDLLGRGIFIVDGHHWRFQRKLASLELGSISVRSFSHRILTSEIRHRLLPTLHRLSVTGAPADLQEVFRLFAFDNMCRFSFGVDPACLRTGPPGASEFAEAFDLASRLSAERALEPAQVVWKLKRAVNVGSERRLKMAVKKIDVMAEMIIRERRKIGFSTRQDLLSRFMATITDEKYLRDIVISFLLAGRDTVASAITVFFLLVAQNPDVESKIREESDRVMGQVDPAQIPTFDQLKNLHFLHATLHEALRLYPPVQIDSKYADKDDVLPDGTWIRKGDKVSFHPYAMGRMPQIWGPDCLEFKPERWLDKDGLFRPVNLFKYPVFQAGFRVCLGKEMALVTMKMVCLSIIRLFDVRLNGAVEATKFVPGLSATLKSGLIAVVRRREQGSKA